MRTLLKILSITLLLTLLAGCSAPPYTNIDNKELKALLAQGIPIVDIRRSDEWRQTGVVKESLRLTFVDGRGQLLPDFLPQLTQRFAKDKPLILICRTGNRSSTLATYLVTELGYSKIYNVYDGISGWLAEGNPVVR